MKKFFEYIGLFIVVGFSFFMTNRTIDVAKNMDSIMIQIKDNMNDYKVSKMEAYIYENTFIPGINGYEVNVSKSYDYMKKVGIYDPNLYVYSPIKVSYKIKDNLDKYIINGNKSKKMVSILIYAEHNNILKILDKIGDTKINFILSSSYYMDNKKDIDNILKSKHNILFTDLNDIDNLSNQNNIYCFNKDLNDDFKDECANKNALTINSNVINNNYLSNVKKQLQSGRIIVFNGNVTNDINTIINYIESKGFKVSSLDNHLNENR